MNGRTLVLGLFFALAIGTIAVFTLFSFATRPEDRDFIVVAVLRDLYLPVVATSILCGIDAYRHERNGWWLYVGTAPVPGINVLLAIGWLARWRKRPATLGKLQL